MKSPLRLGIVGAGLIWRKTHRNIIEKMKEQFTIAGFCVTSEESWEWIATEHPCVKIHSDYREMAASEDIDAMVILTPIGLNAEVALAGLNADKDVFVEKPLASSSAQAEEVLQAADRMQRQVFVLENAFYDPKMEVARMALDDKAIGQIVMYDQLFHGFIDDDQHDAGGYGRTQWRKEAKFPLGTLFDGGIHTVATNSKLFGNPVSVFAAGTKFRGGFGDYDEVSMLFSYPANGFNGYYSHAGYLCPKRNYFQIRGTEGIMTFDRAGVVIEKNDGSSTTLPAREVSSHVSMWRKLVDVIAHGSPVPYDARQAAFDVRVLEAVEKSIKTGTFVRI